MYLAIVGDNKLASALINRCHFIPENVIVYGDKHEIARIGKIEGVQYANVDDYEHYFKQVIMRRPDILFVSRFIEDRDDSIFLYFFKLPSFYRNTRVVMVSNIYELPFIAFNDTIQRQSMLSYRFDGIAIKVDYEYLDLILESPFLLEVIVEQYPSLKVVNWLASLSVYDKSNMEISVNWKCFRIQN